MRPLSFLEKIVIGFAVIFAYLAFCIKGVFKKREKDVEKKKSHTVRNIILVVIGLAIVFGVIFDLINAKHIYSLIQTNIMGIPLVAIGILVCLTVMFIKCAALLMKNNNDNNTNNNNELYPVNVTKEDIINELKNYYSSTKPDQLKYFYFGARIGGFLVEDKGKYYSIGVGYDEFGSAMDGGYKYFIRSVHKTNTIEHDADVILDNMRVLKKKYDDYIACKLNNRFDNGRKTYS